MFESYTPETANFHERLDLRIRTSTLKFMTTPHLLPEGRLIEDARTEKIPRMSIRAAADIAGISEGWWRQVVRGYRTGKGGQVIEVDAPADTVAQMAAAVGVTPANLRSVGRDDAADRLESLQRSQANNRQWSGDLTQVPDDALMEEVGRRLRDRIEPTAAAPLRAVARTITPEDSSTFGGAE